MELPILRIFFIILSIVGVFLVWGVFTENGGMDKISTAVGRRQYPNGEDGLKTFTGWRQLDDMFMTQVGFNLIGLDRRFPAGRLFLGQFLANVSVPVFITTIEGIRSRSTSRLTLSPLLWGLLSQQVTSAVAYPLYCLVLAGRASLAPDTKRPGVPNGDAVAALLGHICGFAIPCLMIFEPVSIGPSVKSAWVLVFVWYPIVTTMCHKGLATLARICSHRPLPIDGLSLGLVLLGNCAFLSHIYTLWSAWAHPGAAYGAILSPDMSRYAPLERQVLTFFQFDYLVTFATFLSLAYYECLMFFPGKTFKLLLAFAISSFVLGPGATLSVAWCLREYGINRREKWNKGS